MERAGTSFDWSGHSYGLVAVAASAPHEVGQLEGEDGAAAFEAVAANCSVLKAVNQIAHGVFSFSLSIDIIADWLSYCTDFGLRP